MSELVLAEEPFLAAVAPIRHGLVAGIRVHVFAVAVGAPNSVRPPDLDEPLFGRGVVGKHLEQFDQTDAFSVVLSWCFVCHNLP